MEFVMKTTSSPSLPSLESVGREEKEEMSLELPPNGDDKQIDFFRLDH